MITETIERTAMITDTIEGVRQTGHPMIGEKCQEQSVLN